MNWLNLLCIAVGLAMDAFAVSIVAGLSVSPLTPRHIFRPAFHFGLFQFMMPVFGWMVGRQVAQYVAAFDHWIVVALLGFVGGKMLWEAFSEDLTRPKSDPTRGLMLVTLSLATSIDAFAVGLSLAFLQNGIWIPALVIGLVAATLSAIGMIFGNRLGTRCGRWAAIGGGCMLLGIGLRILVAHLAG